MPLNTFYIFLKKCKGELGGSKIDIYAIKYCRHSARHIWELKFSKCEVKKIPWIRHK